VPGVYKILKVAVFTLESVPLASNELSRTPRTFYRLIFFFFLTLYVQLD